MIKRYDEVSQKNNLMTSQLEITKKDNENSLELVNSLRTELSVIPKMESQVSVLKSKNKDLSNEVNSVNLKYSELEKENLNANEALQNQLSCEHFAFR